MIALSSHRSRKWNMTKVTKLCLQKGTQSFLKTTHFCPLLPGLWSRIIIRLHTTMFKQPLRLHSTINAECAIIEIKSVIRLNVNKKHLQRAFYAHFFFTILSARHIDHK